jgi:hypothetical protein
VELLGEVAWFCGAIFFGCGMGGMCGWFEDVCEVEAPPLLRCGFCDGIRAK